MTLTNSYAIFNRRNITTASLYNDIIVGASPDLYPSSCRRTPADRTLSHTPLEDNRHDLLTLNAVISPKHDSCLAQANPNSTLLFPHEHLQEHSSETSNAKEASAD